MINIRKSSDRGHADHGWLNARHSFSFASYYDPQYTHHGALRVMNEDHIQAGGGFGMHGHEDMEIITYVITGKLAHKDNMGNGSTIQAGDFQRMSAGTGIRHSEFNPSTDQETHLYQIWMTPQAKGLPTGYEEKPSRDFEYDNGVALIASPNGAHGSMTIQLDAKIYMAHLKPQQNASIALDRPMAWAQVITGSITTEGQTLNQGDGLAIEDLNEITFTANQEAQVLIFDLPLQ